MVWRRKRDQAAKDSSVGLPGSALRSNVPLGVEVVGNAAAVSTSQSDRVTMPSNSDAVTGEVKRATIEHGFAMSGSQRPYIVPRGYKISGDIFATRPVVVEGELNGADCVAQAIFVAPEGMLTGRVRVGTLRCTGSIDAEVIASKNVEVISQGAVSGRVTAPTMMVEPGARIQAAELCINNEPTSPTQGW
jgi:cytoskeletal protein CcmA (bactofilin family)